jgi:hypothetical protein
MLHKDIIRHGMEFLRAIEKHDYEISPQGIYFKKSKTHFIGVMETTMNGDVQVDHNIVPIEALNYILRAGLRMGQQFGNWFVAPFLNNISPPAGLTAANFAATMGEFTAYTSTTRVPYVIPTDPTNGSFSNNDSPATFTGDSTIGQSGIDIWGFAILSNGGKGSTLGNIFCAAQMSKSRNLDQDSDISLRYTVNAVSS